ncbi:peptidoglycan DD-metalloendopeptidase family protein [Candidatus Saccharibacteria bacterium]|nr:peptidoglycan DD-metalloendopeptidase family protein [Candidatus Saccharibacteria bacterium]
MVVKSKQSILWRLLGGALVALLAIFVLLVANATALQKSDIEFYDANNILFYDGEACASSELGQSGGEISGGGVVVSGTEAAEMMWSALASLGWRPEAIAGAMGNMTIESVGFNPAVHQRNGYDTVLGYGDSTGHGVGLVQWDWPSRRKGMYNYVHSHNASLAETYLDDPWKYSQPTGSEYSCDGECFIERAGADVARELIKLEIDYLVGEDVKSWKGDSFLEATSPEDAAKLFDDEVELSSESKSGKNYNGTHGERPANARKYYTLYAGKDFSNSSSRSGVTVENNGANVTIIGDSITLGALNYGSFSGAGLENADIRADTGKHAFSGSDNNDGTGDGKPGKQVLNDLITSGNLRYIVVIALGTNDPKTLTKDNLQDNFVNPINADGEHLIVFVTNYGMKGSRYDVGGEYDFTSNNTAMRAVKDANDNVVIADWAMAVSADESKYLNDNVYFVHPNQEGSDLFAKTIYRAMTNGSVEAAVKTYNSQCVNGKVNYSGGNGVTTTMIGGTRYAFPIAYATKENVLQDTSALRSYFSGYSNISALSSPRVWWHHHGDNYNINEPSSADIGIAYGMTGESERDARYYVSKYNAGGLHGDDKSYPYYASSGAKVVATVGGTLHRSGSGERNGQSYCADLKIDGDDGHTWYYIHLLRDDNLYGLPTGQRVEIGDVIGEIGTPECADKTQSHVHFMIDSSTSGIDIANYLNPLYDALPEDMEELKAREASGGIVGEGGLTYEQAKRFMIWYGTNSGNSSALVTPGLWDLCKGTGSNCVTFSAFFMNKFTSTNVGSNPGNGQDVVGNLEKNGLPTGTEPQVWAVFSWSGGEFGHTGVILGYHDGQWIVGHASCCRGKGTCNSVGAGAHCNGSGCRGAGDGTLAGDGSGFVVMSEDIQEATLNGSGLKFAYFGDQVDLSKIEEYLANGE